MRRGWGLRYGTKFRNGKEKFYIKQDYQIGPIHILQAAMDLDIDDAQRIAETIMSRVKERKQT